MGVVKTNWEWVHLIADHQTKYLCGDIEHSDGDIYGAFNVASVEQGERAYACEATAMSTFFDTFYADKPEVFKSIYLNIYLCTLSLHSSTV